jgi:AcrR family transcriptional regulator
MARTLKEEEFTARRNQILDVAQRLVMETKGYDQTTIQDILDALHISKGAFYHYFDSKGAVLEALVERMVTEQVIPMLEPIVRESNLSALQKLHCYFDTATRWKMAQRALMIELLKVWLADENAIVRQKMFAMTVKHATPLMTEIIQQGIQEGVFTTPYPEHVSQVMIHILQGMNDTVVRLFLSSLTDGYKADVESGIVSYLDALTDAIERVLGAQQGSLKLMDPEILKEWFEPSSLVVEK